MKVFIQVIDMIRGISQYGMIEEPVVKGKEIDNALDDGFWDCIYSGATKDEKSVIIKEISFEED